MTEPGKKPRTLQKRWLVLAAIVVLALIFLIPFIREGGARVDTSVKVETETAFIGDIQETAQGRGTIESARSTGVETRYAGVIETVAVQEGDTVKPGEILAVYDLQELAEQIDGTLDQLDELDTQISRLNEEDAADVVSGVSGLVKAIYAQRGDVAADVIEASGSLMELSTDGRLRVEISLREGSELSPGDRVEVRLGEKTEEGVVERLEEGKALITFADSPDYLLGEQAQVTGPEGNDLGSGPIGSNSPWLVQTDCGIISRVEVEVGDQVSEETPLFHGIGISFNEEYLALMEQRMERLETLFALREFEKNPLLLADDGGIVTGLTIEAGDSVESGVQVCQLVSTDSFFVHVDIAQADIGRVRVGQTVQLEFAGAEGAVYEGRVEDVSTQDRQVGELTVYTVTVGLEEAEGLSVGADADATIVLDSASDALLVPIMAVRVQEDGTKTVEISCGDGLTRGSQVKTGLENGKYVQILQGVQEGEQVVVSSTVVETTVFSLFNFEWIIDQSEEPA